MPIQQLKAQRSQHDRKKPGLSAESCSGTGSKATIDNTISLAI